MEMNNNKEIYEFCQSVPDYAKKQITDGRLKGKTDISPMWRIEKLTEMFGPCGIGWWYVIKDQRLENGADGVVKAFVDIDLYYKWGDQLSQPIPGIGGNDFVAKESKGLYTSDECFKKALSDAISVAAKAIGMGADVYMGGEQTKYTQQRQDGPAQQRNAPPAPRQGQQTPPRNDNTMTLPEPAADGYWYCQDCGNIVARVQKTDGTWLSPADVVAMGARRYNACLCPDCMKKREALRT